MNTMKIGRKTQLKSGDVQVLPFIKQHRIARLSVSQIKSWIALSSLVVRPSVLHPNTSPLISSSWCFIPHKPYIFWKLMTPTNTINICIDLSIQSTVFWSLSLINVGRRLILSTHHTDPPNVCKPTQNPRDMTISPLYDILHCMTFYTIQTKYFPRLHGNHYPLHWPTDHLPITTQTH